MPRYQGVKGMADILPEEVERWQYLEARTRHFFESRGFQEIRTPLLEPTELFQRSIGEGSDIVHKQMYSFTDRGGRNLTLRPEMTASVVRAAIENGLLKGKKTLRLYYLGPMFRAERPQAGRKRQFHQTGIELLNSPVSEDPEVLSLLDGYLRYLGLEDFTLKVNHLGCDKDRTKFAKALKDCFAQRKEALCEDCLYRLERNVLRIFDCKREPCRALIEKAPAPALCANCDSHFEGTLKSLRQEKHVPFLIERYLVRGLDYYSGLVFEVTVPGGGSQDALGAGGRYDGLSALMGGPDAGAIGFAMGCERLLERLQASGFDFQNFFSQNTIYIAGLDRDPEVKEVCETLALELLELGRKTRVELEKDSLTEQLRQAHKAGVRYAVLVGRKELDKKVLALKDMSTGNQVEMNREDLIAFLLEKSRGL